MITIQTTIKITIQQPMIQTQAIQTIMITKLIIQTTQQIIIKI